MVEIEIGTSRATITGERWTSGDETLLSILRQDSEIRRPFGYDPFPALTIAQEAIARYGGRIVRQEPPDYVVGRVY